MTIDPKLQKNPANPGSHRSSSGFSLVELMVAVAISMIIMIALITVFVNLSRSNAEMAKSNSQIENGRFALQVLQNDIVHAGFWSGYVPQFDEHTSVDTPELASALPIAGTVPTAVPQACAAYSTWVTSLETKANLLGIPVQGYDAVPADCAAIVTNKKANTDILIVRHADTCAAGAANCDAYAAGSNLYFQYSQCSASAQGATSTTITLAPGSSATDVYSGKTIRIVAGTGKKQTNTISAYDGSTKVASVSSAWGITPDATSTYSLDGVDYFFETTGHVSTNKDCITTADRRKFISNLYYVRDFAVTEGDGIPTLMRSEFGGAGLVHQAPVALIEGIESFRVEFGIDSVSDSGAAVDYYSGGTGKAVTWANPSAHDSPTNRGDGIPDGDFVRCTGAAGCTVAQLTNVVAVKIYVLARNRETSQGYKDTKTYKLGSAATIPKFDDGYKRHVFSSTVRLVNISSRRETP